MGEVYLARHEGTGEQGSPQSHTTKKWRQTEKAIADFLREAEVTYALHHPQVVELRALGYAAGVFFFTLDYALVAACRIDSARPGWDLVIDEACGYIRQDITGLQLCPHRFPSRHGKLTAPCVK